MKQSESAAPEASSAATEAPDDIVTDIIQRVIACWEGAPANEVLQKVEGEIRRDWGGDRPYIAKAGEVGRLERSRRELAIREDARRGERPGLLARKWGLSLRRIQQILKA